MRLRPSRPHRLGVADIRLAPGARILLLCPTDEAAETLQRRGRRPSASSSHPTDPRTAHLRLPRRAGLRLRPHRRRATSPLRSPPDLADLLDAALHLHISGCAKGCAHPGKAALTLVGSENGPDLSLTGRRAIVRLPTRHAEACAATVSPGWSQALRGGRIAAAGYADAEDSPKRLEKNDDDGLRLHPRRQRDLRALLRHHPRRGRPVALLARQRPMSRCA